MGAIFGYHGFDVCQYNMAIAMKDYENICRIAGSPEDVRQMATNYPAAQEEVANVLAGNKPRAKVFLLQEVHGLMEGPNKELVEAPDTPLIRNLRAHNYEIVHARTRLGRYDCAIAIDKAVFNIDPDLAAPTNRRNANSSTDTVGLSLSATETAIVKATHIATGKRIAFASVHAEGYNVEDENKERLEASRDSGDDLCRQFVNFLQQNTDDCDMQIIGIDLNTNERYWRRRVDIFTNQGFRINQVNEPTNAYAGAKLRANDLKEIDFIFTRNIARPAAPVGNSLLSRICAKIKSLFRITFVDVVMKPLDQTFWNPKKNASDHVPIEARITLSSNVGLFFHRIAETFKKYVCFC